MEVTPKDYKGVQGSLLKDVITLSPGFTELDKKGGGEGVLGKLKYIMIKLHLEAEEQSEPRL